MILCCIDFVFLEDCHYLWRSFKSTKTCFVPQKSSLLVGFYLSVEPAMGIAKATCYLYLCNYATHSYGHSTFSTSLTVIVPILRGKVVDMSSLLWRMTVGVDGALLVLKAVATLILSSVLCPLGQKMLLKMPELLTISPHGILTGGGSYPNFTPPAYCILPFH
ncbi:hypothetical protein J6590_059257 [Homalodisca vitripennis]|nr:hypothetical protein J6590_059257 [Homalodisca vitripennis]